MNGEIVSCGICKANGFRHILADAELGTLVKCADCGVIYARIRLTLDSLKRLNRSYLPSNMLPDKEHILKERIKEANEDLERIEKFKKPGNMLDIGSAAGVFLKCAKERGWKVSGTEISMKCILRAEEHFDIKLRYGTAEELEFPKNNFDAVTLIQVIEHMRSPVDELLKLRESLKKDGIIYITTPEHSKDLKLLKKHHMLPHHIYNYERKTLENLLKMVGFTILLYEPYTIDDFPYMRITAKNQKI